jgi:hypothetical protein
MDFKYILKLLLIILIIFSLIIFINSIGLNLNENIKPKKLLGVVTIEALEPLISKGNEAFCKNHFGFDLEKACNKLTRNNCSQTSCCSWTTKCKASNKNGIIFND